jgi:predicted DNA-binding antitoxin AbrB/MazE fold protein
MAIQVDAVYENGVLKPLRPLDLAEHEQVVVVIKEARDESHDEAIQKAAFMARICEEIQSYEGPVPSLEEVRRILSKVPGSLSEEIIASRGPR